MNSINSVSRNSRGQQGVTLIELLVGIAIGLLTIAVAIGALIASRGASGTTTDASLLQQQASYAFRVIGQQARQAGSIQLNLAVENAAPTDPITPEAAVAFTPSPVLYSNGKTPPITPTISGKDAPTASEYKLSFAYQNYVEPTVPSGATASFFRDCLGQQPSATVIQSQFALIGNELQCAGSNNNNQAIIRNVADFQVRYLIQSNVATGLPTLQSVNAAAAAVDWRRVFGTEICLVLYGDESISIPDGSTYLDCDGNPVNMSSTGSLPTVRKNRMHMVFRSVYQLRSIGQPTDPNA